jgi:glutamate--cysteine ligase
MARDQIDMTPIESRDALVAWFAGGVTPKAEFRIGTEHEKFPFTVEGHRPIPYEGRRSIRSLLEGMQHLLGWEPIVEDGNIIGMFDVTGGGAIRSSRAASSSSPARRSRPCTTPARS